MRALVLSILMISATAYAGDANEVGYMGFGRAMRTASADAVTPDELAGVTLTYARALDGFGLADRLALWADARMEIGDATGQMFQSMDTKLGSVMWMVGARARYMLHSHVAVGARFDVGIHRTELELTDGDTKLSDSGWGMAATGAAGIDLYAYASPRFAIGLRVEVAYTKTQAVGLTMHREGDDDGTIKLPVMDTAFGHLDTSGPSFTGGLIGRF
jgi:hypothetical protein